MNATRTTCPYCGVGCGVLATRGARGAVDIAGDPAHPANRGRLCVKGAALGETLALDGRLLYPKIGARRAAWGEALDAVAQGFQRVIGQHGPNAVAFYLSAQLLTEDYYVANKLVKGFIGTGNIDTNSRLCMASAVAGHKRAFGADTVPVLYEDLELADLVVLVGSNAAWCHPVIHQRLLAAREKRPQMKLVVVDPRRTVTCEQTDLHLAIRPGTDVWLFNGLLAHLAAQGLADTAFVEAHTAGAAAAVEAAGRTTGSAAHVARVCGVPEAQLFEFYRLFARTERSITAFSQGVNQSSAGVDKVNAIINCHLYTGRIGKPGMGPFSITGQPNAMGGREVGGLANMLAAHLELGEPAHRALVRGFWESPQVAGKPGLKAVELFDAIDAGRVKAVWIMATNPVVSLPDADKVRRALARCELVVVSDVLERTDTTALAHVLLPAAAWGEKDGTVTNSERCISRQRAFLPLPGEAKPDWWIITQVARRMGHAQAFPYRSGHEIFREHAALSAHRNSDAELPRDFNLAAVVDLAEPDYDALEPFYWPALPGRASARMFGDGRFYHADRKARLIPLLPRAPANPPDDEYPLVLNTGRLRDQWHTMTRTGKAPRLASHQPEPYVEIHPKDAMLLGVQEGRLARVATRWGACVVRVRAEPGVPRRHLFVPIHWNDQTASDARVGALVNPVVDPVSGEPEFKHTPVRIEPFLVDWHGFLLLRQAPAPQALEAITWWTRVQGEGCVRYELAGRGAPEDWSGFAQSFLGATQEEIDWLEASDVAAGMYRAAYLVDDRLEACLFVSPRIESLPGRAWLSSLFLKRNVTEAERAALLAGQPGQPQADAGATICSCFGVGRNRILRGIREEGLATVAALGAALKCGTNCGSCVPELGALVAAVRAEPA